MKRLFGLLGLLAALLLASVSAFAQNKGEQRGQQPQTHTQQPQAHAQQPQGNAQHGAGERGVGNGHIPAHGPARAPATGRPAPTRQENPGHPSQPPQQGQPSVRPTRVNTALIATRTAIRKLRTCMLKMTAGLATIRAATMFTIISTIPGSTGISLPALARSTFGVCAAVALIDLMLAVTTSRWRLTIMTTPGTGYGITTTS